jgi:murein DD-endopeptidase MepM/ murein hydrolase activator NlpD
MISRIRRILFLILLACLAALAACGTPELNLCSPLQGITISELPGIISEPYAPPPISQDDGHHGVDFAFYRYKDFVTMEGLPVQAVLPGTVAAVIDDRFPYGNMLIIETPLELVPGFALQAGIFPTPAPTVTSDGRLVCPDVPPGLTYSASGRSLYILYAHLQSAPQLAVGDTVTPCQVIGAVGSTGSSSQFHLHVETRLGPAGARFTSIAHRSGAASEEEMATYCTWRISELFQRFDPMLLFALQP